MTIAAQFKAERERRGLSLRKASTEVGVAFSTLARMERGDGEPEIRTERAIRRWLGEELPMVAAEMDFVPVPVSPKHAEAMIAVACAYLEQVVE